MLFVSMLEILIDRNEHNDSGGYKGKYEDVYKRQAKYGADEVCAQKRAAESRAETSAHTKKADAGARPSGPRIGAPYHV